MSKKVFEVALLLTAKDEATRVMAAASARQRQILAMSERGDKAFSAGRTAGGIGLGIAAALALPIKAAADMESMNISLKTSFQGNAKAAEKAFSDINKFAAATPYGLEEVMTSFIKLKNMGLDPSEEALTAYGNTASAMGKSLNDMVEAVADAATGEFERLKEFGIKASSQGEKVTFMFQGVKTTVGKNSKEIEQYLKYVGNVKFAGGIVAQSKSVNGMLSTLKDGVVMTAAKIGTTMIPRLKNMFNQITPVIDKIASWVEKNPKLTETILKVAVGAMALSFATSAAAFAFGGIFKVISVGMSVIKSYRALMLMVTAVQNVMAFSALAGSGALGTLTAVVTALNLAFLANPITWVVAGVVALIAVGYLLVKNWSAVKEFFANIFGYLAGVVKRFFEVFSKTWLRYTPAFLIYNNWSKITAFFSTLFSSIYKVFAPFFKFFIDLGAKFFGFGINIISGLWGGIKSKLMPLYNFVKSIGSEIAKTFKYILGINSPSKVFMEFGTNITEGAHNGIKKGESKLVGASKSMASAIKPNAGRGSGGSSTVSVTFAPVIHGGSGDVASQVKALIPELIRQIESQMQRKARLAY